MKEALIAIQARSGSTRLPRKAFELIGAKMMLDHVIDACKKSASFLWNKEHIRTRVIVVTPDGDPIAKAFANRCEIIQGSHLDVLSRYAKAMELYKPDILVRITGDCPLIPAYLISRIVSLAERHDYDYVSNVDERFRTALDGMDCEAISSRLFSFLHQEAVSPFDREHVTTYARSATPAWAKVGAVINFIDHSQMKLSVDTPDDLERVRKAYDLANDKFNFATRTLGHRQVHTI